MKTGNYKVKMKENISYKKIISFHWKSQAKMKYDDHYDSPNSHIWERQKLVSLLFLS